MILPEEFLSLSENTRLIVYIDELVLYAICTQIKVWHDTGFPPTCVSVNLSEHTFQQPNLVETVTSLIQNTRVDPQYLGLEITEHIVAQDIKTTLQKLSKLSKLGIQISIDDFGKGLSSVDYLKTFPINKIKISPLFMRGIATDHNDKTIVSSLISLAQSLQFKIVAKGVETEEQLNIFKQLQCKARQFVLQVSAWGCNRKNASKK